MVSVFSFRCMLITSELSRLVYNFVVTLSVHIYREKLLVSTNSS